MSTGNAWAAVLFDLDGTLADTVELILRCYRHTMKTHLGRELPDDRWLATIGTPLRDQFLAFARDRDEARAMEETYVTFQRGIHDRMVKPYPGVVEVVRRLQEAGTALGVVTSKRSGMATRTLSRCGCDGAFATVVCADHVDHGKPDPEPVTLALERLGLVGREDRVLFVGDSPYDIRAGKAAGTRTAGVLWGPYGRGALAAEEPDYLLQRPDELLGVEPVD